MGRKLVVTFPGIRGTEIPLLYFGSKLYEDMGYGKMFIQNPPDVPMEYEAAYEAIFDNAVKIFEKLDLTEYEDIVFIGKSMGSAVAGAIKEKLGISATLVFFTPIEQTLRFIREDNNVLLVAMGTDDKYMDYEKARKYCENAKVDFYLEQGVGHRMEVNGDYARCLEVIGNVIGRLEKRLRN